MKILIYTEPFYPSIGGVATFSFKIAKYLTDKGVEVTVVTETPEEGHKQFPFVVKRRPERKELRELVDETDLVFMNGMRFHAFLYSKIKRKKLVMTYHDLTMLCPKGTKWLGDGPCRVNASIQNCVPCLRRSEDRPRWLRRLFRPKLKTFLSAFIDANICCSSFCYENYELFNKNIINNGSDTDEFFPAPSKQLNTVPKIVCVGRVIREKGCQVLLKALAELKKEGVPFQALFCGDGPYLEHLSEMTKNLRIDNDVLFLGAKSGESLVATMQSADIAVIPTLLDEPAPLAASEAMACGLPVVASDGGGLGTIVKGVGIVYERNDVCGLVRHLRALLLDPSLRQELGRNGREAALVKYNSEVMASNYYKLFQGLAKN